MVGYLLVSVYFSSCVGTCVLVLHFLLFQALSAGITCVVAYHNYLNSETVNLLKIITCSLYMTVYRKTGHNAAPFEIFFLLHLQSCRHPDIELSKFYRRSLSCSHYNRPNRSLPSAWNNTFLRNQSICSRYLRTPRCARFFCRRSHIFIVMFISSESSFSPLERELFTF